MASYMVRVELHRGSEYDYSSLHAAMERAGFSREILSTDGVWYRLPPAEYYVANSTYDRASIVEAASRIASTTGRGCSVIVTQAEAVTWQNLTLAT